MNKKHDTLKLNLEDALKKVTELETQMDNLFANMSLGFFLYEIVPDYYGKDNIRVLMINQPMADLLRVDRKEALGKFFYEIWPGQEYQVYLDLALDVAKTGVSAGTETYDDDLGVYINVYMYRPKIGQVAVIASDRTEMVKTEENLQKAYLDMSTILNEIPAPICVIKAEGGEVLTNNLAFIKMCGYTQDKDMIGQSVKDYLELKNTHSANELKDNIFSQADFICDLIKVNGEKIQVKVFSRSLKYNNKEAFALHLINLTKQQSDEKALRDAARAAEEASALKSKFLANMSHEIRTPMNAIKGLAELLALTELNSVQDGYVRNIVKSSNSLLSIINDILDFSKINENKIELIEGRYFLEDLIAEVSNMVSLRAAEKGLMLLVEISPSLPKSLVGDDVRVKQVMINILNNAVKYTPDGYVIMRLSGEETSKGFELVYSVEDTGIGIKEEDIPFLFEAFSQADRYVNHNIQGTGLGLSISDQLTKKMGGNITVKSEYGKGSIFTVRFPQRIDNPKPLATVENPDEKHVLLLTRNVRVQSITNMLKELGVSYVAVTAEKAFNKIIQGRCTHCIYDDSFSENFIRNVRIKTPDCVFIALKDMRYAMERSEFDDAVLFLPLLITELVKSLALIPGQSGGKSSADKTIDDFILVDTHVMVVDDNEINLIVSGEILHAYKAEVTCADSGQNALNLCEEKKYDIIFMDHMMPVMDGMETTIAIREGSSPNKNTPIIALTANVVNDMATYYIECGMDDFISKPIELKELRRVLLKWLPECKIATMEKALQPEPAAANQILENSMDKLIRSLDAFGMYVSDVMREIENDYDVYVRRMDRIRTDLAPLVSRLRSEVAMENWDNFAEYITELGLMIHDVGARDCAGRARKLANAAREKNVDYIRGDFFALMDNMYMLEKKMEIAVPLALGNISANVPFGDINYCYDRMLDMQNSLATQDYETSITLLESLSRYSLDHALDLILVNIGAKLSAHDFSGASDALEQALRHCEQILKHQR